MISVSHSSPRFTLEGNEGTASNRALNTQGVQVTQQSQPTPRGAGLRDVTQRGMTLGVETHPVGPRRATQEGTTGGERMQPLKPNNTSSANDYQ